ncbi:nucleolin 2-like [Papaver somniferum]|uniref:nucleolin 2-like n=1 Tax=Papaver somniferum TaxID=3469 RepID=UPI000E70341C|nr:nucleolin 2-like [Papaver somniferum]
MADPAQNSTNSIGNLPNAPPVTPEFAQAKSILPSLSIEELQQLREHAQSEIDHRIQEKTRQREAEEADEGKAEKQAKTPKFGSSTESDSEASEGYEYEVEEVDTSDLDSDSAEDKQMMNSYHDEKARRRFEYELTNPKIFARTMSEGEPVAVKVSRRIADLDDESSEEEREEGYEDSDDESSSSGTSPAPYGSKDYGEEGLDTDEDERCARKKRERLERYERRWIKTRCARKKRKRLERYERRWIKTRSATESESDEEGGEAVKLDEDDSSSEGSNDPEKEARERQRQERDDAEMHLLYLAEKSQPRIFSRTMSEPLNVDSDDEDIPGMDVDGNLIEAEVQQEENEGS